MSKIALLIGVSEYGSGLTPLPSALKDIKALQKVLQQRDIGNFDDIKILPNPTPDSFRESVENLFQDRNKNDLILLFFSGHGIKDDNGKLYFATHKTKKNERGTLIKSSAVPASFVQDIMNNCRRCKRQVLILDCCYSGAFAQGMTAKDDGNIDIKTQLGGEGRAILTSSSSTQYSFEQEDSDLSVYTRFIVEGLRTGTADTGKDGIVSINELHEYARKKVQDVAPSMKPEIIAQKEGYSIHLANAPVDDPLLTYRREVEYFAQTGQISAIGREALNAKQSALNLDPDATARIEAEVLKPYREHQQNYQRYEKAFANTVQQGLPLESITRRELNHLQDALGLTKAEAEEIHAKVFSQQQTLETISPPKSEAAVRSDDHASKIQNSTQLETHSPRINSPRLNKPGKFRKLVLLGSSSIAGFIGLATLSFVMNQPTPKLNQPTPKLVIEEPESKSEESTSTASEDKAPQSPVKELPPTVAEDKDPQSPAEELPPTVAEDKDPQPPAEELPPTVAEDKDPQPPADELPPAVAEETAPQSPADELPPTVAEDKNPQSPVEKLPPTVAEEKAPQSSALGTRSTIPNDEDPSQSLGVERLVKEDWGKAEPLDAYDPWIEEGQSEWQESPDIQADDFPEPELPPAYEEPIPYSSN